MNIFINFHNIKKNNPMGHIENFKKDVRNTQMMLKFIKKKYRFFYEIFLNNLVVHDNIQLLRQFREYNKLITNNLPEFYVYSFTDFLEKNCDINLNKYQELNLTNLYSNEDDMSNMFPENVADQADEAHQADQADQVDQADQTRKYAGNDIHFKELLSLADNKNKECVWGDYPEDNNIYVSDYQIEVNTKTGTIDNMDSSGKTDIHHFFNIIGDDVLINENENQYSGLQNEYLDNDFSNYVYKSIDIINCHDIWDVYVFGSLNDITDLNDLTEIKNRKNIYIFIFEVTIDIINCIYIILQNKYCNYKIFVYEITLNPFNILNNLYYGNNICIYKKKIKKLYSNPNIMIQNIDIKSLMNYLDYINEISENLNILKNIHKLYSFYSISELNIDSKIIFNKLFYGIVPYFVVDKKYISKFRPWNNRVYIYNNTYYTRVTGIYQVKNFYKLEL